MSRFETKVVYCPNCGSPVTMWLGMSTTHLQIAWQCGKRCYDALSLKTTRSIMGKPEPVDEQSIPPHIPGP